MNIHEDYSRSEIEYFIDEFIFNERDREILKRRLLDGALYKELANEFHLDYDYIRKELLPKCESKLFRRIEKWEKRNPRNPL